MSVGRSVSVIRIVDRKRSKERFPGPAAEALATTQAGDCRRERSFRGSRLRPTVFFSNLLGDDILAFAWRGSLPIP